VVFNALFDFDVITVFAGLDAKGGLYFDFAFSVRDGGDCFTPASVTAEAK
jgi:hypothetical protein